jgi:O-antigen ligase
VALLLAALIWAGVDPAAQRFARAPADIGGRLGAWRDTVRIVRDFPVFGSGLNTYGTAMLLYQTGDRRMMYQEAHNDYLQLAAEGGLLLGIPATIAAAVVVREIRRRFRERRDDGMRRGIRIGAVAALAGIAVQSLADFSLQMPGNAAFFAVVAAIAVHRPRSPEGARAARL